MTLSQIPTQSPGSKSSESPRLTRRVSSLSFVDDESKGSKLSKISRHVSQDYLASVSDNEANEKDILDGRCSPVCCVSGFDNVAGAREVSGVEDNGGTRSENPPQFANPLHDRKLLDHHKKAVQLEADLLPMRLILSRLIAHPTLNRKGLFNSPVDPVALKLPDYFDIIKNPMDLGTIKVKLHAIAYGSREEVAKDIRLVFLNAMKYNPPYNAVHCAAKDLLAFFEEQVQAFVPDLSPDQLKRPASTLECFSASATTSNYDPVMLSSVFCQSASASPSSIHTLGTREGTSVDNASFIHTPSISRKRKRRGTKVDPGHACDRCEGRSCGICDQGCLAHEPTLLICNGPACAGAKIRKGAVYFIANDGSRQFCQRCHTSLPPVLPCTAVDGKVRYKRDLLKRKNEEEVVERWVNCSECRNSYHQACVMFDPFAHTQESYTCPPCTSTARNYDKAPESRKKSPSDELFTFVCGAEYPVAMTQLTNAPFEPDRGLWSSESLPENELSSFIQGKVRTRMMDGRCPNSERTVHVRVISDCDRFFMVPGVVRKHFRMATANDNNGDCVRPPVKVHYRSKAVALFQKIDGLDVCLFCMYVHEYDGNDEYEDHGQSAIVAASKRVYIAYLDSLEHFRPRACRTNVFQELLVSYLATARKRGYETAHIWACPPSRGNSFVFWNHPPSQRTPSQERLEAWYHSALSRAGKCGVVTNVQSLYESHFQAQTDDIDDCGRSLTSCPPLLDGDFWIDEAVRIHSTNMSRCFKIKAGDTELAGVERATAIGRSDPCPARQLAVLLRDRVLAHESSLPFRRPVNAAAMNLKDYHSIIKNPMDLGTVFCKCVLGEYFTLGELVSDVELVCTNAQLYNPEGHIVHTLAQDVRNLFFCELNHLVRTWGKSDPETKAGVFWEIYSETSLNLDATLAENAAIEGSGPFPGSNGVSHQITSIASHSATDSNHEATADFLNVGPEAVSQRMAGEDRWLLDKNPVAPKGFASVKGKKGPGRRRKRPSDSDDDSCPSQKRRRQCWLGAEVGAAVRKMRTAFFTCSLVASSEQKESMQRFSEYSQDYSPSTEESVIQTSTIADARHSLLEFSQYRNLEYDTLRHAKHSTAVLLYHLHNGESIGIAPKCSSCSQCIREVRWHKTSKISQRRSKTASATENSSDPVELCTNCHAKVLKSDEFIPIQVSMR